MSASLQGCASSLPIGVNQKDYDLTVMVCGNFNEDNNLSNKHITKKINTQLNRTNNNRRISRVIVAEKNKASKIARRWCVKNGILYVNVYIGPMFTKHNDYAIDVILCAGVKDHLGAMVSELAAQFNIPVWMI